MIKYLGSKRLLVPVLAGCYIATDARDIDRVALAGILADMEGASTQDGRRNRVHTV